MISIYFITIVVGVSLGLLGMVWIGIKRLRISNSKTSIQPLSMSSVINLQAGLSRLYPSLLSGPDSCLGQALVEFTLVFLLLLVIAWIPADFGLAFYTGQLALNASREGARVAAVTIPFDAADAATQTCKRLPSALLSDPGAGFGVSCSPYGSNARVQVVPPAGTACNKQLTVTVTGDYDYFFYRLLRFFGADVPATVQITRSTQMRWEHQNPCT
jgi:Flp pilus assembly protein TadG